MSRICIDCRYVNGRPSGIGELVTALAGHLPQMAPELEFLLLTTPNAPGLHSKAPNVEHLPLGAAANGPGTMWWLPRIVDLSSINLFHATYNIMPSGLSMPCVTTVHDLMWLDHPELCGTGLVHQVRRAFFTHGLKRALRKSTAIATVSQTTRKAVLARVPAAASRTFVTLSGVSEDFSPIPRNGNALTALRLDPQRRFVLVVGQYAPYKNHEGALAAFAKVARQMGDLDLVFVQRQGPDAEKLLRLAQKLEVGGHVHVLRQVAKGDLVQLYSAAALLLHPSFCEGFGNPLAEAMACGCPVITSTVSAMPEVTGNAALLADPSDHDAIAGQLATVLASTTQAALMRERGLARAAQLRWSNFAEATLSVYRNVLERGLVP